ncbi:hypothetical protein QVD17_28426 [Tagetes erecta]|uniref:Uncharacterized protein n=1 Tax=Tagetes erecta TaxID=13708 RepID=A0AAD8KF12_TARER|nr:hypothetical protein QVD17_28426 [Tagetes erecta]
MLHILFIKVYEVDTLSRSRFNNSSTSPKIISSKNLLLVIALKKKALYQSKSTKNIAIIGFVILEAANIL